MQKLRKEDIMKLNNIEMQSINGGGFTSSMLNAISKAVTTVYNLGKNFGSSIRRLAYGKYCPIN